MTQSVLGSITLGYQLLWNRQRELAGVELFVDGGQEERVDAAHLLRTLRESWAGTSPDLLLTTPSPTLLCDLLEHAQPDAPWLEIDSSQLQEPGLAEAVQLARQRGARLLWRGPASAAPEPALASALPLGILALDEADTLLALHASRQRREPPRGPGSAAASPVRAGQLYRGVASRELMRHCLDEQGAQALVGWPVDDVVHGVLASSPARHLPPADAAIRRILAAVERDASMDVIEHIMAQDPVLAYRFMQGLNAAALGLRDGIDSLRHGLMMLGYGGLQRWLEEQRIHAHRETDLQPVLSTMVLRAELMAHLLDAGVDDELDREVYLCGLFSQLDVLLGEPLRTALLRIRLPDRVLAAILDQSGPYLPYLDLARALEQPDTLSTQLLCEQHELSLEDVNRGLLRVLSAIEMPPGRMRLG